MSEPFERLEAALVSRYRIERELGAGGMATVYLAEDIKHDRKVAIKILPCSPPSPRTADGSHTPLMPAASRRSWCGPGLPSRSGRSSRTAPGVNRRGPGEAPNSCI